MKLKTKEHSDKERVIGIEKIVKQHKKGSSVQETFKKDRYKIEIMGQRQTERSDSTVSEKDRDNIEIKRQRWRERIDSTVREKDRQYRNQETQAE